MDLPGEALNYEVFWRSETVRLKHRKKRSILILSIA